MAAPKTNFFVTDTSVTGNKDREMVKVLSTTLTGPSMKVNGRTT